MATKNTHTIETDIHSITPDNLPDKLKEHMSEVIQYLRMKKCTDIKIHTRIKEVTPHISVVITDMEDLNKLLGE